MICQIVVSPTRGLRIIACERVSDKDRNVIMALSRVMAKMGDPPSSRLYKKTYRQGMISVQDGGTQDRVGIQESISGCGSGCVRVIPIDLLVRERRWI